MDRKLVILVVDDNRSLVKILELVLKREGFNVVTAFDGLEGLKKARTEKPDLIVLDVIMPGMDGYSVCHRLQQNPETAQIPIILLTIKGQVDNTAASQTELAVAQGIRERMAGFDAGAVEFLSKPIVAGEVIAQVKKILGLLT